MESRQPKSICHFPRAAIAPAPAPPRPRPRRPAAPPPPRRVAPRRARLAPRGGARSASAAPEPMQNDISHKPARDHTQIRVRGACSLKSYVVPPRASASFSLGLGWDPCARSTVALGCRVYKRAFAIRAIRFQCSAAARSASAGRSPRNWRAPHLGASRPTNRHHGRAEVAHARPGPAVRGRKRRRRGAGPAGDPWTGQNAPARAPKKRSERGRARRRRPFPHPHKKGGKRKKIRKRLVGGWCSARARVARVCAACFGTRGVQRPHCLLTSRLGFGPDSDRLTGSESESNRRPQGDRDPSSIVARPIDALIVATPLRRPPAASPRVLVPPSGGAWGACAALGGGGRAAGARSPGARGRVRPRRHTARAGVGGATGVCAAPQSRVGRGPARARREAARAGGRAGGARARALWPPF